MGRQVFLTIPSRGWIGDTEIIIGWNLDKATQTESLFVFIWQINQGANQSFTDHCRIMGHRCDKR